MKQKLELQKVQVISFSSRKQADGNITNKVVLVASLKNRTSRN